MQSLLRIFFHGSRKVTCCSNCASHQNEKHECCCSKSDPLLHLWMNIELGACALAKIRTTAYSPFDEILSAFFPCRLGQKKTTFDCGFDVYEIGLFSASIIDELNSLNSLCIEGLVGFCTLRHRFSAECNHPFQIISTQLEPFCRYWLVIAQVSSAREI